MNPSTDSSISLDATRLWGDLGAIDQGVVFYTISGLFVGYLLLIFLRKPRDRRRSTPPADHEL